MVEFLIQDFIITKLIQLGLTAFMAAPGVLLLTEFDRKPPDAEEE